jgi:predicted O-linked N-acetylglucosamine transferase (SPINDLY family)
VLRWLFSRGRTEPSSEALNEQGLAAWHRGDLSGAETAFRKAIEADPGSAGPASNLGMVLFDQGRFDEGLGWLRKAVAVNPHHAGAQNNLGIGFARGNLPADAARHFRAAVAADPGLVEARVNLWKPLLDVCDWATLESELSDFGARARVAPEGDWVTHMSPFVSLLLPIPRDMQRRIALAYSAGLERAAAALSPASPAVERAPRRLRVGYVSSDFYNHATAHLAAGLFARHDRRRFEIYAYSIGPGDTSEYRRRIVEGCDRFVEVGSEPFEATARRIAADGVHIAVDMKGYCGGGRPEVFALRPAPIQVSFLGYPGSTGATFIDYLIADRVVAPESDAEWFSERLVWMPASYQVNDSEQPIADRVPARTEVGLPERGFVFCCFNQNYKIDAQIFALWMRILAAVPDSVLWLFRSNLQAKSALCEAALRHGVAQERLVFATKLPKAEHLARHKLADLFLDTHFVNAHTTASDALWAGVPLLTWPGETFASRVAASLLHAIGLPELVAPGAEEYEAMAIALARDPQRLQALRERLAQNRLAASLFDTGRYVRDLERAYGRMWSIHASGARPSSFSVASER